MNINDLRSNKSYVLEMYRQYKKEELLLTKKKAVQKMNDP